MQVASSMSTAMEGDGKPGKEETNMDSVRDIERLECRKYCVCVNRDSEKVWQCSICHLASFKYQCLAEYHVFAVHLRNKTCTWCKQTFPDIASLKQHCSECESQAAHIHKLNRQNYCENTIIAQSETEEKSNEQSNITVIEIDEYPCTKCGQKFFSKKKLHWHQLRRGCALHQKQKTKEKKDITKSYRLVRAGKWNMFQCVECRKCFHNQFAVKKHIRRTHWLQTNHACSVCARQFYDEGAFRYHTRSLLGCRNTALALSHALRTDAVPRSDNAVLRSDGTVPRSNDAKTRSDNAVPRCDNAVPRSDDAKTRSDNVVPRSDNAVPRSDDAVPRSDNAVPRSDDAMPRSDNAVPRSDNVVPRRDNAVPRSDNAVPRSDYAMPKTDSRTDMNVDDSKSNVKISSKSMNEVSNHLKQRSNSPEDYAQTQLQGKNDESGKVVYNGECKSTEKKDMEEREENEECEWKYQCRKCKAIVVGTEEYRQHLMKELKNADDQYYLPVSCSVCKKRFTNRRSLLYHTTLLQCGRKGTSCKSCHKRFVTGTESKEHKCGQRVKRLRNKPSSKVKMCRCVICEEEFEGYQAKLCHMKMHHPAGSSVVCIHCKKLYKSAKDLRYHKQVYHPKQRLTYKCSECAYYTMNKYALNQHRKKQHEQIRRPERHACEFCNTFYTSVSSLKRHLLTHEAIKAHVCHICGKGFVQKCSLDRHLDSHQNIKRYKCAQCQHLFTQSYPLTKHVKTFHPELFERFQRERNTPVWKNVPTEEEANTTLVKPPRNVRPPKRDFITLVQVPKDGKDKSGAPKYRYIFVNSSGGVVTPSEKEPTSAKARIIKAKLPHAAQSQSEFDLNDLTLDSNVMLREDGLLDTALSDDDMFGNWLDDSNLLSALNDNAQAPELPATSQMLLVQDGQTSYLIAANDLANSQKDTNLLTIQDQNDVPSQMFTVQNDVPSQMCTVQNDTSSQMLTVQNDVPSQMFTVQNEVQNNPLPSNFTVQNDTPSQMFTAQDDTRPHMLTIQNDTPAQLFSIQNETAQSAFAFPSDFQELITIQNDTTPQILTLQNGMSEQMLAIQNDNSAQLFTIQSDTSELFAIQNDSLPQIFAIGNDSALATDMSNM